MFRQIVLIVSLIPLNIAASNAAAASSTETERKTVSSAATTEADNKQLIALGEKIKDALRNANTTHEKPNFAPLFALQANHPEWFYLQCCEMNGQMMTPLRYYLRQPAHDLHIIACLIVGGAPLSEPESNGIPLIFEAISEVYKTFAPDWSHDLVPYTPAQILLFDVNHPNACDANGNTILHTIVLHPNAAKILDEWSNHQHPMRPVGLMPYSAARHFVSQGVDPEARNNSGKTALELVSDNVMRLWFRNNIGFGKSRLEASQALATQWRTAISEALSTSENPSTIQFQDLARIIQQYVGNAKSEQLLTLMQQFKREAPSGNVYAYSSAQSRIMKAIED